uniref:HSPB1 associated protein 1 n=1 Tax=Sphenodon punctatus TaxID=8508 RepID=A0A8D0HNR7_SPHPU
MPAGFLALTPVPVIAHTAGHFASSDLAFYVKPFTPEEAREIVMSLEKPAVFRNMVLDWPALHWNVKYLCEMLGSKTLQFRMGVKKMDTAPQFETKCSFVEATLEEFLAWNCEPSACSSGPFHSYDSSKYWAYADYKYIARIFEDKADIFQEVKWSDFGFLGRNGRESTLWIGSAEANTPCHVDSYGCNLVLQVQGRKRWHLFPPEETSFLYPTRIPYEESSIFSQVNVVNPDLKNFPLFKRAQAHVVTLNPGQGRGNKINQGSGTFSLPKRRLTGSSNTYRAATRKRVLFVPRRWWHYVESIDQSTVSINSWIELDTDHEARVEEAITRTLVCAIKSVENPSIDDAWLNPTEVSTLLVSLDLTDVSLKILLDNAKLEGCLLPAFDSGLTKAKAKKFSKIPFGLNLIQVLPQLQEGNSTGGRRVESDRGDLINENEEGHFGKLPFTGKPSVMNNEYGTLADQTDPDSQASSCPTAISTNDLLDCVVNPQVVSLVARLLLDRARV